MPMVPEWRYEDSAKPSVSNRALGHVRSDIHQTTASVSGPAIHKMRKNRE